MNTKRINDQIQVSTFESGNGCNEYCMTICSGSESDFIDELDKIYELYLEAGEQFGLGRDTVIASRIYLSDAASQVKSLSRSKLYNELKEGAVSVIQQASLQGGSVSLLMYHVKSAENSTPEKIFFGKEDLYRNGMIINGNNYDFVWTVNFAGNGAYDSFAQTLEILSAYNSVLQEHGMNILNNGIRTWIYVRDIDNQYKGMVRARREFFEQKGLNPRTRYLASTGIEGASSDSNSLISLDAFSINNLNPEQIIRMDAPGFMCPTDTYGVTFERGLRIRFGDRSHLHISGTASIDEKGNILHKGDVQKQTERALKNIRELLSNQNAEFTDLVYIVVYLRNSEDAQNVQNILSAAFPSDLPLLILEGSVCRPDWLVEIEGLAIIADSAPYPPFF